MIDPLNKLSISGVGGTSLPGAGGVSPTGETPKTSFADVLKQQIGEVSQLQQDASKAVEDLATGKSDDVTGVFVAMEKSETAFKTLLSIRSKLLEAYDEIKNMPI
jgi:flagellar hook-basal body complex protein FliE